MGSIGPEELGELFDCHARSLVLYARQWCEGLEAEDVVQEAFLALARQEPRPAQEVAWLYRVVRNSAISATRSRRRRLRRETHVASREAWFSSVDHRLDAQHATQALSRLGPEVREVIVARVWGALSFEQVGALAGCSPATAYRRYQAGLTELQEILENTCTRPIRT
jgi:RNA polymerase sigma-70 factor (ECF subfamily)